MGRPLGGDDFRWRLAVFAYVHRTVLGWDSARVSSLSCHRSHLDLHVVELGLHELPETSIGRVAAELSYITPKSGPRLVARTVISLLSTAGIPLLDPPCNGAPKACEC